MTNLISEETIIKKFKNIGWLSALGARICYSNQSLEDLLQDPRISSPKMNDFLLKLNRLRHGSVFAHSFAWFRFNDELTALKVHSKNFKSIYYGKDRSGKYVVGLSLRHILESGKYDNEKIINSLSPLLNLELKTIDIGNGIKVHKVYHDNKFKKWCVFVVEGLSRVSTHQIVRHTMLNFSQRSDRYVNNRSNTLYLPETIENKLTRSIMLATYTLTKGIYSILLKLGVKKEDARYVLPCANRSTLMISGHSSAWNYFLELRTNKSTQLETRKIAEAIRELLES